MIRVKDYKNSKKIGIHIILLSALLIFITVFGFTLSKTFTSFIQADTEGAIRGQSYDLWADIVLGKRDFGEISPREVVADKVSSPGGVIVDRSVSPGRMYIWDSGNSRILGINLQDCYATDTDERCTGNIVIGQPSLDDYGACNHDASFQYYPNSTPASASTICGIPEWTHTTLEHKTFTSMFVAPNGDLYVADVINNRVLKYISPFTTDQIADEVWGQPDFTGTGCNVTGGWGIPNPSPSSSSLCFNSTYSGGSGVALDSDGNLWVADGGNYRVVRYPNNSGTIAKVADIVIGQENFTSTIAGNAADDLQSPTAIRFASNGDMYISDSGNTRVQLFKAPFTSGMDAFSTVLDSTTLTDGIVAIEMFPDGDGFWTYEVEGPGAGFRDWDLTGTFLGHHFTNWNPGGGSMGIDALGNILVSAYVYQQDVARFAYDSDTDDYVADKSLFFPPGGYNLTTARRLEQGGWGSVVVVNNQLIVSDSRLLYWNNPLEKINGQAPDGYVGGASATDTSLGFTVLKADSDGKIYAVRGNTITIYQAPLTNASTPLLVLTPPFTALGGGTVGVLNTIGGLAPTAHGEYLWVSNPDNNRVFRIKNPLTSPVVDIILGQTNLSGVDCNRNIVPPPNVDGSVSADRSMLCVPGALSLDKNNNLFLSDHFFESAGNWRLLMYSADLFPDNPGSLQFNISATKEFPRVNNITHFEPATFETAFDSTNRMVVGYNPYFGPRFLEYYNDPTSFNPSNRSDPAYAVASGRFKDFGGWVFSLTFDSNNNLFAYDTNRGQVLIYKDPFGTAPTNNGGGDNNGNNNQNNNSGNGTVNYSTYSTGAKTTGTKTNPTSYVQVNDEAPLSFTNTTVTPPNTTQQAIDELVTNTESNKTLSLFLGVIVELAKNSSPQYALNFAGFSLGLFLLIIGIALGLSGANIFGLIPLLIDSLLNRKKIYGGVIYNAISGYPIALAKVIILRKDAVENGVAATPIEYCLTDLEGRYKLSSLPSKNLSIEVKSLGYEYFIKTLPSNLDVALKPISEATFFNRILSVNKFTLFRILRLLSIVAAVWGYVVTIYAQVAKPDILNILLLAIYSILFILATYPSLYSLFLKRIKILDSENNALQSAVVRVYQDKNFVDLALTNKKGTVKFNLEEGMYRTVTTKPGYSYSESDIEIGEEGNVKNQIKMSKTNQIEPLTTNLDLHDQVIQNNHEKFNLH